MESQHAARRTGLVIAYTLLWVATRWPAIAANTLFFDDFDFPFHPFRYTAGSYRPVLWLEYLLWDAVIPNFLWTHWPKILGAIYTGLAAMSLAELLRKWGVAATIAAVIPTLVVLNPVLADGALWATCHALPLGMFFAIESARSDRRIRGFLFALLAVFTYQVFIALIALLAVAEPLIVRATNVRRIAWRFGVIALAAIAQLAFMLAMKHFYPGGDPRGLADPASLAAFAVDKWHGATNLLANGWMPVIAYYTGALRAMSLWKWIPIAAALVNGAVIREHRAAAAIGTLIVLAMPAAPILVTSSNPEAWRAATPVAFALAIVLVPPLMKVPRAAALCVIAALAALMAPVSWYESSMRVASFQRDRTVVESIRAHWRGSEPIAVAFGTPIAEDREHIGSHELTWGFQIRTPAMWTMLFDEQFARRYLVNYHRLAWSEERACRCGPITHLEPQRVSVICGQSPPCASR